MNNRLFLVILASLLIPLSFLSCELHEPMSEEEYDQLVENSSTDNWDDNTEEERETVSPINFPIIQNGTPIETFWELSGTPEPYLQTTEYYQGSDAVQFATEVTSDYSYLETNITLTETQLLSFWLKANAEVGEIQLTVNGIFFLDIDQDSEMEWTRYDFTLPSGTHELRWTNDKYYTDNLNGKVWLDQIILSDINAIASSDFSIKKNGVPMNNTWTFPYTVIPIIQGETYYQGDESIQLGIANNSRTCNLETTIILDGPSVLSFWALTETDEGRLSFYLDDYISFSSSNISEWTEYTFLLESGSHTLEWSYNKNSGNYNNQAWIDYINLTDPISLDSNSFPILQEGSPMSTTWTSNEEFLPYVQESVFYEGTDALQLGYMGSYGTCDAETTLAVTKAHLLSFWGKADSGGGYLSFTMNTDRVLNVDTLEEWRQYFYLVEPGNHSFKWRHYKYSANSSAQAWIDYITLSEVMNVDSSSFPILQNDSPMAMSWTSSGDTIPLIQSETFYQGDDALLLGLFEDGSGSCSLETSITLAEPQILSFWAKVDAGNSDLEFQLNDSIVVSEEFLDQWTQYQIYLDVGTHNLKWTNETTWSHYNHGYVWLDCITLDTAVSVLHDNFETNDGTFSTINSWMRNGNALPEVQTSTINGGSYALQFGDIHHMEYSSLSKEISLSEPAQLSFWYKVSSEEYNDFLNFFLDDQLLLQQSGSVGWTYYSINLQAGSHNLQWEYRKDSSYSSGEDTAWLDDIHLF